MAVMDVAGVIDSFAIAVTLVRFGPGSYDNNGMYSDGSEAQSDAMMVVAPATPRDLQVLPEGLRTEGAMRFFSKQELRTAHAGDGGFSADRIVFDESTYELQQVESWEHQGAFWSAIGIRMEQ